MTAARQPPVSEDALVHVHARGMCAVRLGVQARPLTFTAHGTAQGQPRPSPNTPSAGAEKTACWQLSAKWKWLNFSDRITLLNKSVYSGKPTLEYANYLQQQYCQRQGWLMCLSINVQIGSSVDAYMYTHAHTHTCAHTHWFFMESFFLQLILFLRMELRVVADP